ncbi:hypothetical protein D3C86_1704530 [compost metagenome]
MCDVFPGYDIDHTCKRLAAKQAGRSPFDDLYTFDIGYCDAGQIKITTVAANHWLPVDHDHGIPAIKALHLQTNRPAARTNIIYNSEARLFL